MDGFLKVWKHVPFVLLDFIHLPAAFGVLFSHTYIDLCVTHKTHSVKCANMCRMVYTYIYIYIIYIYRYLYNIYIDIDIYIIYMCVQKHSSYNESISPDLLYTSNPWPSPPCAAWPDRSAVRLSNLLISPHGSILTNDYLNIFTCCKSHTHIYIYIIYI